MSFNINNYPKTRTVIGTQPCDSVSGDVDVSSPQYSALRVASVPNEQGQASDSALCGCDLYY
jgi:hypothetical protein